MLLLPLSSFFHAADYAAMLRRHCRRLMMSFSAADMLDFRCHFHTHFRAAIFTPYATLILPRFARLRLRYCAHALRFSDYAAFAFRWLFADITC